MPQKINLSRGSLSNWCDADGDPNEEADADADISKTICQPPPYGGGQHKNTATESWRVCIIDIYNKNIKDQL